MLSAHASPPRQIVLIGYPGAQSLDLVGPLEVFSMANRLAASGAYEVILASEDGGEIICNSGLRLAGAVALADLPDDVDTILISGGDEEAVRQAREGALPAWLAGRQGRARRIGSVCSGSFVLAAAGLLDGRRVTTHWGFCDEMRAFRPAVRLEPDAIFVADPPFFTSAGVTAGLDLCLALVEGDCGAETALAVARNLVLFLRRAGGQAQYSAALTVQTNATSRLRTLIAELSADPCGDLSVPCLAGRAAMSERTFSRVFKKETGVSPAAFVATSRLNRAKALLESSDWALHRVAERAGFGDISGLHRAFQKWLGVTPGEYRERFGPSRGALGGRLRG
jgi:transcriptional regulator GlxA family with amidase domain